MQQQGEAAGCAVLPFGIGFAASTFVLAGITLGVLAQTSDRRTSTWVSGLVTAAIYGIGTWAWMRRHRWRGDLPEVTQRGPDRGRAMLLGVRAGLWLMVLELFWGGLFAWLFGAEAVREGMAGIVLGAGVLAALNSWDLHRWQIENGLTLFRRKGAARFYWRRAPAAEVYVVVPERIVAAER